MRNTDRPRSVASDYQYQKQKAAILARTLAAVLRTTGPVSVPASALQAAVPALDVQQDLSTGATIFAVRPR